MGGLGALGCVIFMQAHNGSKLDFWLGGLLIHVFELKISIKTCCCDDHLPYSHLYICYDFHLYVLRHLPMFVPGSYAFAMYVGSLLYCRVASGCDTTLQSNGLISGHFFPA